jgi:hypothetical protein
MEIFPVFKKVWSQSQDDWLETSEVLFYEAVLPTGLTLARGETKQETLESALLCAYMAESNAKQFKH